MKREPFVFKAKKWMHRYIIGPRGQTLRNLKKEFQVEIVIPPRYSSDTDISVSGDKENIRMACRRMLEIVKEHEY